MNLLQLIQQHRAVIQAARTLQRVVLTDGKNAQSAVIAVCAAVAALDQAKGTK